VIKEKTEDTVKSQKEELTNLQTDYSKRRKIYEDTVKDTQKKYESLKLKLDKKNNEKISQEKEAAAKKDKISRMEQELLQMKETQEKTLKELKHMRQERYQEQEFLQQVQMESNNWYRKLQTIKRKTNPRFAPVKISKIHSINSERHSSNEKVKIDHK